MDFILKRFPDERSAVRRGWLNQNIYTSSPGDHILLIAHFGSPSGFEIESWWYYRCIYTRRIGIIWKFLCLYSNGFKKESKGFETQENIYGFCQSPRAFWEFLTKRIKEFWLNQTQLDPCLFVGEKVVCICYVDDIVLWSQNSS